MLYTDAMLGNANRFEPGPMEKQTHQDPGQMLLEIHRWPLLRIYHLKYMFFLYVYLCLCTCVCRDSYVGLWIKTMILEKSFVSFAALPVLGFWNKACLSFRHHGVQRRVGLTSQIVCMPSQAIK